ncbi:hypothetical protein TWF696_006198 [Orbilia brochopaga]|uniref:Uncharacterized protein n=1 Tax=Orbilia brochopaga TaxID=3140254 RepID=A0AAV9UVK5_9PEZI
MKFSAIIIAAIALISSAEATKPPVKCDAKCKDMPCLKTWCQQKGHYGVQYFTVTVPGAAQPAPPPRTVTITRTVEVRDGDGDTTVTKTKTCTRTVTRWGQNY